MTADVEERPQGALPVADEHEEPPGLRRRANPGSATSPVWPTYCQKRRKIRSCSSWSTSRSVYQLQGSVLTASIAVIRLSMLRGMRLRRRERAC